MILAETLVVSKLLKARIKMYKRHLIIAALAMPLAFSAHAQTVDGDDTGDTENIFQDAEISELAVPALADVISELNETEILQMEQDVSESGSLAVDTEMMIETEIEAALAEGVITAEQATDAEVVLEIVNANAEYFDFDILQEIALIIAEGEFTEAQIRQTLEAFDSLSDADKALVAQEEFDALDPTNALYQQVSDEGKAIIQSRMPVLSEE
jgi:hypothetical protein